MVCWGGSINKKDAEATGQAGEEVRGLLLALFDFTFKVKESTSTRTCFIPTNLLTTLSIQMFAALSFDQK